MKVVFTVVFFFLLVGLFTWMTLAPNEKSSVVARQAPERSKKLDETQNAGIDKISRNRNAIIDVQRQLYSQGVLESTPSGVIDADTVEAINRFQRNKGLEVTGQLDVATLNALGVQVPGGEFAE